MSWSHQAVPMYRQNSEAWAIHCELSCRRLHLDTPGNMDFFRLIVHMDVSLPSFLLASQSYYLGQPRKESHRYL